MTQSFDLIIRNGTVYDGSGGEPIHTDIAVAGDQIARIGPVSDARAGVEIDAAGLAVAPGFINVLSHSYTTMLMDGRSLSELVQGVTTQVFGEGVSMGPWREEERQEQDAAARRLGYDAPWTSLAGYLDYAERRGVSQNVCSFIGATTLRRYVAGDADRPLTPGELDTVRGLIRDEMSAGALGIGSSLIYAPASYASTEELIEMCRAAAPFSGMYVSHIRNESDRLLESIEELIAIAWASGVHAEVYHLKAAGRQHWHRFPEAVERIAAARASGLPITADMYTYTASGTGLNTIVPPRFHEGGPERLYARLADPADRAAIREAIATGQTHTAHAWHVLNAPESITFLMLRERDLRPYLGRTLADAAAERGQEPLDAALDIILADRSRVGVAYDLMSEENVRLGLAQPWVSFGSDDASVAPEGRFLRAHPHPRAYGNFARLLGRYVREQRVIALPEAIRRLTRLPADTLGLDRRGRIEEGYFADLVVFDPNTIADRATLAEPHQYAVGVEDVIVNGTVALRDGACMGALAGRALHGRGKR